MRIWNQISITKKIFISCILTIFIVNCAGDKKDDNASALLAPLLLYAYPTNADLPQPALNTANLIVGEASYTKNIGICRGNFGVDDNIQIPNNDFSLPAFFLHKVDFSKTSDVFVTDLGNFVLNVGIPPGGGAYDPIASCPVKIMENSNTIYDIQVKDCQLDKIQAPVTPAVITLSFRVRCSKGL
ncbi:hypothetical protein [Leptospira terpstrae]|nr:hypothetical protein [Leptospira terpstrae]